MIVIFGSSTPSAGTLTVADLLLRMEVFDAELDTSSGGKDEARAMLALDMAQDAWEAIACLEIRACRSHDEFEVAASDEFTDYPAGLLRLDSIWVMDGDTPSYELDVIEETGKHIRPSTWINSMRAQPGAMAGFWTDEQFLFWAPSSKDDAVIRIYGMWEQEALDDRADTFAYVNMLANPLAACAVRFLKVGLEDGSDALKAIADELFAPVLKRARRGSRSAAGPSGRSYTQTHTT